MDTLDFPTKKELANSNNVEFKIFVPSTRDKNIPIMQRTFDRRINEVINFVTKYFSGATIDTNLTGAYSYKGTVIKENVAIISVFTTQEEYNKKDKLIEKFLLCKRNSWKQDSMGFEYEGQFIFI